MIPTDVDVQAIAAPTETLSTAYFVTCETNEMAGTLGVTEGE